MLRRIAKLNADMERLARAADWDGVRDLMRERDVLLGEFSADNRGVAFEGSLRSNERVKTMALAERQALAGRISKLKRGRHSASQYEQQQTLVNRTLQV